MLAKATVPATTNRTLLIIEADTSRERASLCSITPPECGTGLNKASLIGSWPESMGAASPPGGSAAPTSLYRLSALQQTLDLTRWDAPELDWQRLHLTARNHRH
jgi:hypothetical protein